MKSKWLIRMLAVLICVCTLMLIPTSDVANAEYTKEDLLYTPDDTLSKYIEDNLPDGDYEMVDSKDAIICYNQMAGEDVISYVRGEFAKEYGITQARYFVYAKDNSVGHFFLDISLSADAVITDNDRIHILFSGLTSLPLGTSAELYLKSQTRNWKWTSSVSVNNSSSPVDGDAFYLSGDNILNNGKSRRIFIHIPEFSLHRWIVTPYFDVMWNQDMERLAELPISQEKEDNTRIMEWKIILVGLILVFDVAMLVFFLKYIKKPQKEATSQEITTDSETEIAEAIDEEAELMKLSGNRNQEEIDYLKRIGYFNSKSSK